MSYDLIGDIHGHAETLEALLLKLEYEKRDGVYSHPSRRVIFLGDFIDGGPEQRRTIEIVRPMIDSGRALAVLGNHEFNAVAFATPDDNGGYLRPRSDKNLAQHDAFLNQYPADSRDYKNVIGWFRQLPLWLDLGGIRVIHACWDRKLIQRIAKAYDGPNLSDELLAKASDKGRWEYNAVETLLKGKEIPLPQGHHFHDRYGTQRHHIRIRWWDRHETTYRGKFLGSKSWETHIPDDPIDLEHEITYGHSEPPVFLGHYWLEGTPKTLEDNVACLDYSVGRPGGKLVSYRWDGESRLDQKSFVSVNRVEP